MAESLDDGEFWLPPQFLTDDDLFFDNKITNNTHHKNKTGATTQFSKDLFPLEFPYGFDSYSSDLSSPIDSVLGSAEESDEDDLLTCRLPISKVEVDFKGSDAVFGNGNTKGRAVSGSPQSTLCGVGSGCMCSKLSSNGSPNECSKVSSPPATWDLLHAAAGEVARIRMDEEGCILNRHSRGILGLPQKPSPVYMKNSNPDLGFFQQQSIAYQKLQASQFHQMRQQQMMKQQGTEVWGGQAKGAAAVYTQQQQAQPVLQARGRNTGRPLGLSPSVWPPIQQAQHRQGGSGMRAVFLGNRGAKRECAGTGVFLPRQIGTPTESRKKTACSTTVLLPAKVVQVLKLDDGGQPPQFQHRFNGTFHPGGENGARPRNCNVQKRNLQPQQDFNTTEVRLPKEWTY
ncbi:uncharacterized protein [Euphorbia lathyris]|uniref:uncharacterized protein n=1 Tax=Euphorbia lathyris TaxID=212925 RepID=UPI00331336CE